MAKGQTSKTRGNESSQGGDPAGDFPCPPGLSPVYRLDFLEPPPANLPQGLVPNKIGAAGIYTCLSLAGLDDIWIIYLR